MKLITTAAFDRDYARLPERIQQQADKKLLLLLENPRHPSLNLKKMQGRQEIWRMKITAGYRLTLQIGEDTCILRRLGPHDVLKKP